MTPPTVHHGDSREVLKTLADNSIDSVVCDPPYALVPIAKRFGAGNAAPIAPGVYGRGAAGFMGKKWDTGDTAHDPAFWREVWRVLKPGGHLVAFGGTRTFHRLAVAIEDAGFEIRDQIGWCFGVGFPKSHALPDGWGTAIKPAWEPICLARKPLSERTVAANVLRWGTGAINVDGCRVGFTVETWPKSRSYAPGQIQPGGVGQTEKTGPVPPGRWPANIVHDGSDEVVGAFPETGLSTGGQGSLGAFRNGAIYGSGRDEIQKRDPWFGDSGSAARFFYSAKATSADRHGSKHPTVKPVDLMAWLCRLVTPPGGTILDPFAGSGTTGLAAMREGFGCILIEREAEYIADIERRLAWARGAGGLTAQEKSRAAPTPGHGPLFGAAA